VDGAERRQRRHQRAGRARQGDRRALPCRMGGGRQRCRHDAAGRDEPPRGDRRDRRGGIDHCAARVSPMACELLQAVGAPRHPTYALYPATFDELENMGLGVAGTAEKVRDVLVAQAAEAGVNYLVCRLAFGDLTLAESMRSLEFYAGVVMPAVAGMREAAE